MKTKRFNERWVKWYERSRIKVGISTANFSELPNSIWDGIEKVYPLEDRWEEVIKLLNKGDNLQLKEELRQLEIKLSRMSHSMIRKMVDWRDTNFPILSYDEDGGQSSRDSEDIMNIVYYFCRTLNGQEWYVDRFTGTDEEIQKDEDNRKRNSELIFEKLKEQGKL